VKYLALGCLWISLVAVSACSKEDKTARPKPAIAAPNVVSLTATEYSIAAPDTIPAGWTTFRLHNYGTDVHYGHMVRLDPGKTVEELVTTYAEAIRTSGPRPKWLTRFGGPGGAAPGDSSSDTQYLEPGSYVWICPVEDDKGNPHFSKGEFKPFVVSDHVVAGREAAPKADMVIRLVDFSFAVDTPLVPGRHTIRVENTGAEPHDLVMMKLMPGKTIEDIRNWMNPERARRADQANGPAPSIETLASPGSGGGIAVIAPKMESFIEASITPGEYALFCMATAPDGRSHMEHGMIRQISAH
jgi:hypothetical protein